MKIFRAHRYDPVEGSLQFQWFGSKSEASEQQSEWNEQYEADTEIDEFYVSSSKHDFLSFLNAYCTYADNG